MCNRFESSIACRERRSPSKPHINAANFVRGVGLRRERGEKESEREGEREGERERAERGVGGRKRERE